MDCATPAADGRGCSGVSDKAAITIAVIGAIGAFAASSFAALIGLLNNSLARRNEQKLLEQGIHIHDSAKAIILLEKNTNSIKDALVKVTGEAEFAKGLKVGTDAAKDAATGCGYEKP